jgi:hypothetical protein
MTMFDVTIRKKGMNTETTRTQELINVSTHGNSGMLRYTASYSVPFEITLLEKNIWTLNVMAKSVTIMMIFMVLAVVQMDFAARGYTTANARSTVMAASASLDAFTLVYIKYAIDLKQHKTNIIICFAK